MLFIQDASELLLPTPGYWVVFILGLCVYGFRHVGSAWGRARYLLLGLLVWSYVCTLPILANVLIAHLEHQYPSPKVDAKAGDGLIVVLASGYWRWIGETYDLKLDEEGWERTYAGVRLWRRVGGRLLFVGGPSPDDAHSAADLMASVARDLGVPAVAVIVEGTSRSTHQNLLFSRDLIARRREDSWLVTSALHMPRAMAVAGKLGLRLQPYPCDYRALESMGWRAWLPNSGAVQMYSTALHELLGLGYYRVMGYAT